MQLLHIDTSSLMLVLFNEHIANLSKVLAFVYVVCDSHECTSSAEHVHVLCVNGILLATHSTNYSVLTISVGSTKVHF